MITVVIIDTLKGLGMTASELPAIVFCFFL